MIIIGHRGARGLAPENSLASFDAAIAQGAEYVEFDIRLTRDKKLVVIHDRHTQRIAFIKRHIKTMTLQEIKALATRDGLPIPTLEEVLQHIRKRVKINIEVKVKGTAPILWATLQPWLQKNAIGFDQLFVSSSRLGELRALRKLSPELRLALLQRRFPFRFLSISPALQLFAVGTRQTLVTPWCIRLAKNRGLFTYVYTVNSPKRAARLQKWGIDGICTDRPDLIKP